MDDFEKQRMLKFWGSKQFLGREIRLSICLFFKERKLPNKCKTSGIQNRISTSNYITFDFHFSLILRSAWMLLWSFHFCSSSLLLYNFNCHEFRFMIWTQMLLPLPNVQNTYSHIVPIVSLLLFENIFENFSLHLPSWHWPLLYELGSLKRPDFHKEYTLHLLKSVCSPSSCVILATKNGDSKEVIILELCL